MAWHHENEQRFEFDFKKVTGDCDYGMLGCDEEGAAVVFTRPALERWIADAQKALDENPAQGIDAQ